MRALVTGATGFIGSHLVEELTVRGYEIRCLVRRTSNVAFLNSLDACLVQGSLDDPESLENAVAEIDIVFHAAGLIKTKPGKSRDFYCVNCEGTQNLLDAMARSGSQPKRFVYFSSQAAAGPSPASRPLTEDDPCNPITPYGRSKLEGERVVKEFTARGQCSYTIIRPPAVFGPRDREVLYYFKQARKGWLPAVGSARNKFSIVYVKDLVNAALQASESVQAVNKTYFVCYPEAATWARVAELFGKVLSIRCRVMTIPYPVAYTFAALNELYAAIFDKISIIDREKIREVSQPSWLCSPEKIKSDIGFTPGSDIQEALRSTVEWYKAHHLL